MNGYAIMWFVLMLLFLGMEAGTVSMVSIWFAAGSLAGLICSFFAPLWVQIVVAFVVSGILLAALRPVFRKYIKPNIVKTNAEALIGTRGKVLTEIDNQSAVGQVKLGGMEWTARSTTGAVIPAGTLIRVDRIEGVKVFVSPAEETAAV